MNNRVRFAAALMIVTGTLAIAVTFSVKAQPARTQAEPIAALLSEVHALRLAMEQTAAVGPRIQLAMARLNIEEQRIAQLATPLIAHARK